jgi:hypothetical protein
MQDRELSLLIDAAVARIRSDLEDAAPFMAGLAARWMEHLADGAPEAYFKHPLGFPMLLFPWWLEKAIHDNPDLVFHGDLVHSTVSGYYYVRLVDNLMDGHATVELHLLPVLGFFHTLFQAAYQRYFDHAHPFWNDFKAIWFRSAEVTIQDALLEDIDRAQFEQIAAQKTCAARIPLTAVCHRYDRQDLIAPWSDLLDLFGCWHQMWNDVFGWIRDTRHSTTTHFLSEAERRKGPTETATEWILREGMDWGIDCLQPWMDRMQAMARDLGSEDLVAYLDGRQTMLLDQRQSLDAGLRSVADLLDRLSEL